MQKISFIIPIYNEAENISELYQRLKKTFAADFNDFEYEVIFIDDGSSDDSFKLLSDLRQQDHWIKVIQLSRNFGHHIALTAGLDHTTGDYVVMMDGDLQDQPEEIIKLYNKLQEGYEVVYGERVEKRFGFFKRLSSNGFNWLIRKLIQEPIVINSTIFRIMTRQVVEQIRLLRERDRYIVGIIGWVGFRQAAQPVDHGRRFAGQSKYNWSRLFALAFNAIFSFSSYPLKIITKLGLGVVAVAFALGVSIMYRKLVYDIPVMGWSSLIVAVLIMGGTQIIILGVIGEYIGRAYMEEKRRPLYIVKKYLND